MSPDDRKPIFVPPHSGRELEFLGVTHKLIGEQTAGACYLFETAFEPGTGNNLHIHRREDEIGYVLEGALEVRLGTSRSVLEAGGIAMLPKGTAHAIHNPLETTSRYLFMVVPAGLDQWFDAVARAKDDGLLDDALFRELSEAYGLEWVE